MRENALQAACLRWARETYGGRVIALNIHGGGWSNKGFPDILLLGRGKAAAVELKSGSGYALQPDQRVWAERLARAGVPWALCESLSEFAGFAEEVFGRAEG